MYSTSEFIEKAKIKHNNKYDYSKSCYIKGRAPITIVCPIHGEFKQLAAKHLEGRGCKRCGELVRGYCCALSEG